MNITDEERELVLSLLPKALNESGIALALGKINAAERALAVLRDLEASGRVVHESTHVWKVV